MPDVRADPRRQVLARASPRHRSSRSRRARRRRARPATLLAGLRIDQVRPLAGEIDKELLAGAMHLAHRRLQRPAPTGDTARKTGCRRSRPDALRAILLPRAARASRPASSVPDAAAPSRGRPGRAPAAPPAAQTGALPARRHRGRRAAATSGPPPSPAAGRRSPSPGPPHTPAQWRGGCRPASYFRRSSSRSRRISSLVAAIQDLPYGERIPGSRRYRRAFSLTGTGVHDHRNPCSSWPESAFMMTGIGVQHRSESVFTFDRNDRSRWAGIRNSIVNFSLPRRARCSRSIPR